MSGGPTFRVEHEAKIPPGTPNLMEAQTRADEDAVARTMASMAANSPPVQAQGPQPSLVDTSVDVLLPDGRLLSVGPPAGATAFLVTRILATGRSVEDQTGVLIAMDMGTVKALLYVRALNGQLIPQIRDMAMAQQLLNVLGDVGLDYVQVAMQKFWRAPKVEDLQTVKKS